MESYLTKSQMATKFEIIHWLHNDKSVAFTTQGLLSRVASSKRLSKFFGSKLLLSDSSAVIQLLSRLQGESVILCWELWWIRLKLLLEWILEGECMCLLCVDVCVALMCAFGTGVEVLPTDMRAWTLYKENRRSRMLKAVFTFSEENVSVTRLCNTHHHVASMLYRPFFC